MANEMLQPNPTNTMASAPTRLLVATEMSLKSWRLAMAPADGVRKRVKTVEVGNCTWS